jgi:phosphate transport system permease protein
MSSKQAMSKRRLERCGLTITGACVALVAVLVVTLIVMVASHGLATFTTDGIPLGDFLLGTTWNPHQADAMGNPTVGALPMICGSFAVTLLATAFALPIAVGSAIFVVEVAPGFGRRVFQPLVELLVGIPSVVFGLIGLTVVVAWTRGWAGGTGYGIFSGAVVLAVMVLPTITSLSIDAVAAVPMSYREGSYALGCTRWQTIWNVVLRSARPSLMTATILGMTRAFGESLAVQMVIGNSAQVPGSLFTPASTLTSILTMGMGNEAMGTVYSDALWSLALLLLGMSLVFILIIHLIGSKGVKAHA